MTAAAPAPKPWSVSQRTAGASVGIAIWAIVGAWWGWHSWELGKAELATIAIIWAAAWVSFGLSKWRGTI